LRLYHGDILDFIIESVIPDDIPVQHDHWDSTDDSLSSSPIHLLGNLPFNIAIPLLIRWLQQVSTRSGPFAFGYRIPITICMQEAVAGRIVSSPLLDQRGRLSIIFQNWFDCRIKHVFSGRAFVPAANVNVAVMQLIPLKRPLVDVNYEHLDRVTRAAFHTRNKKMATTMA
jgi:dimethyladenosine transferase 1, mitochondrial